jgi:hypothetical protein
MKAAEADKREEPISTPRFHQLADEVEARARDIWSNAHRERMDGEQTMTTGASIDEPVGDRSDPSAVDSQPQPGEGHRGATEGR